MPDPTRWMRPEAPWEAASTLAETLRPKLLLADFGRRSGDRSPMEGAEVSAMEDDRNLSAASVASSLGIMSGRDWDWYTVKDVPSRLLRLLWLGSATLTRLREDLSRPCEGSQAMGCA